MATQRDGYLETFERSGHGLPKSCRVGWRLQNSAGKLAALHFPNLIGKSFLDVGCNEGYFCNVAKKQGATRVVGIDINEQAIQRATLLYPDCEFLYQSWDMLPAGSWDIILHTSSLHYAADPYALIKSFDSSLADDGVLILEVGVSPYHNSMIQGGQFELGGAFWERVERRVGSVYYPSEMLLRSDLLADFAGQMGRPECQAIRRLVPTSGLSLSQI